MHTSTRFLSIKKLACAFMAVLLAFTCCFAAGCNASDPNNQVAATVQGQEISEESVAEYIQNFRNGIQCDDDSAWKSYLEERNMTPEEFRSMTIQELASPIIVQNKADELGITVSDEEVSAKVDSVRSMLLADDDDDTWNSTLEHYGTTQEGMEDTYRKAILRSKVLEEVVGDVTPTDNDIKNYTEDKLLGQSTKKIWVLYSADYTSLQKTLRTVQNAEDRTATMSSLIKKPSSKSIDGVKLGWDINAELTDGMKEAIAELKKGDVVDALYSDGSLYYLFYVEDSYKFPSKASKLGTLKGSLKSAVSELAAQELETSAGNLWLKQQIAEQTQVNDMPSGLSYDVEVDLSANTSGDASSSKDTDGSTATGTDSADSSDSQSEESSK